MKTISAIITAYNSEKYVCDAVKSVLKQTYPVNEIIVIDDGSIDDTGQVLKKFASQVRYIYKQNGGPGSARNEGINAAKGDLIAFLDADDLWKCEKIKKQINIFNSYSEIGMVTSIMEIINKDGIPSGRMKPQNEPGESLEDILIRGAGLPSTFLIKKEIFKDVGLFSEDKKMYEDWDMILRIAERHKVININDSLAYYRDHPENDTKNDLKVYISQFSVAEKWLNCCPSQASRTILLERLRKYSFSLVKEYLKNKDLTEFLEYLMKSVYYRIKR